MANDTSVEWIACDYNWTGPLIDEPLFGSGATVGYLATFISVLFYGCNFVPLKFVNTGDGFFTQWVMCAGIWQVGLIIQLIRGVPQFHPLVIVNGLIWSIGNCCVAPIINLIGLALGMLLWNCTNIFFGWASGRFGFFNVCPQVPGNPALNYAGVALCLTAAAVYGFVKTDTAKIPPLIHRYFNFRTSTFTQEDNKTDTVTDASQEIIPLEPTVSRIAVNSSPVTDTVQQQPQSATSTDPSKTVYTHLALQPAKETKQVLSSSTNAEGQIRTNFLGHWPENYRRILGIALSLFSGCCYGIIFVTTNYVQDHVVLDGQRASQSGIDYAFTLYSGIFLMSTTIFIGYVVINKNPFVDKAVVIPAILCGLMWGVATAAFLVANEILSSAVTFPIVGTVPGMLSMCWGILLFKEVTGTKNFIILAAAFSLTTVGVILAALSKVF